LRGSFRLKRGQVVEVIWDADPSNSVRYKVIWTGNPGSKREGEAGLEAVLEPGNSFMPYKARRENGVGA